MISVVIPVLNGERTIGAQLAALRDHPIDEFEVVVADNGSSDGTADVVESFTDSLPVRLVDASGRRGASAARNIGAAAAHGDFVVFTDADDVVGRCWLDGWQRAALHLDFGTGPLAGFVSDQPSPDPTTDTFQLPRHMGFLPYAFGTNFGIRHDIFDQFGGFDEALATAEDVDLSWRLALAGVELHFVTGSLVAVRRKERSIELMRQYFAYGRSDPLLYKRFRAQGLRRPSAREILRGYGSIVARLPFLGRADTRGAWSAQVGRRAGRLVGSVEAKAFLP